MSGSSKNSFARGTRPPHYSFGDTPSAAGRKPAAERVEIPEPGEKAQLLDLDLCADVLEFLFDVGGLFLGDPLLQDSRRAVDQILGFLQAEAGDFPDALDRLDLVAGRQQMHRELGLLLLDRSRRRARRRARRR